MLLIGGFLLLCSSLLLLAFLCRRKRWVPSCPPLHPGVPGMAPFGRSLGTEGHSGCEEVGSGGHGVAGTPHPPLALPWAGSRRQN